MPRRTEFGKIPAVDLAYALNRLIQEGKTSIAEVRNCSPCPVWSRAGVT